MKLLFEAFRSAAAQPVASSVVALIVAGVCAVILSTTGQTVKAEQDVLSRIDDAGTRSIIITDISGTAAITSAAVDRLNQLEGVEWAIGLGPARDVRSAGNPGGNPAAIRTFYGYLPSQVDTTAEAEPGQVITGPDAQQTLGFIAPYGGVIGETDYAVVGGFVARDPLAFLSRSLLLATDDAGVLRSLHILVTEPSFVGSVTDAALTLIAAQDPISVGVETSQTLADVRAAVQGELGRYGRQLVTLTLTAGLVLTALAVYSAVTSRRRDFGRRRALGASRSYIIELVATQTVLPAFTGAILGISVTAIILTATTGVTSDPTFAFAIGLLAILTAVIAAIPPAVVAAYRDPVRVLRVP
jgi:putative ABC transport system permease protein